MVRPSVKSYSLSSSELTFSGIGDLGVTLSVNLLGAPSMTPADFQKLRANPLPILAASVKVVAPTGHYEVDKLINVSANRWAIKAGYSTGVVTESGGNFETFLLSYQVLFR
jgi:hypothetical protein